MALRYRSELDTFDRPPLEPRHRPGWIRLDKNEAPFSPLEKTPGFLEALQASDLRVYPDPYPVYQKLSAFTGLPADQHLLTFGRLGVVDTLPDWAIQGLQRLGRSVEPGVRYRKHAKEIQFGEAEKRVIRDRVARSNAKLAEDHSLDLQALGYAVADDPSVHAGTGLD